MFFVLTPLRGRSFRRGHRPPYVGNGFAYPTLNILKPYGQIPRMCFPVGVQEFQRSLRMEDVRTTCIDYGVSINPQKGVKIAYPPFQFCPCFDPPLTPFIFS